LAEVKKEQENNDTPQDRSENKLLTRDPEEVERLWVNYRRNMMRVVNNKHKFVLAYGSGGVGKTFEWEEIAEKMQLRAFNEEVVPNKNQYDYVVISGKISPSQVFAEMYRHRDKIIVFDDCDSFLQEDVVQGWLKKGLDTGKDTKIKNLSPVKIYNIQGDKDSGEIPNTFQFKGKVIAISNLTIAQFKDKAVLTRALISNLTMTVDETIIKLGKIKDKVKVWSPDKTEEIPVSTEARDLAYRVIKERKDSIGNDINTRLFSNCALMAQEGMDEGIVEKDIKLEMLDYFDSVSGTFDAAVRKTKR